MSVFISQKQQQQQHILYLDNKIKKRSRVRSLVRRLIGLIVVAVVVIELRIKKIIDRF